MPPSVFFVCLAAIFSTVSSGWIDDLKGAGLDLGDSGLKLFLDKDGNRLSGRSILEDYNLRMGYSGLGLSLGQKDNNLDVGIYYKNDNDKVEGRGKKMGQLIIPLIMGFKASAVGSVMMAAVGALVMKSLMFSKLALLTSSMLALYKFFGSKSSKGGHVQTSYHTQQPEISHVVYGHLQPEYNHVAPSGYANYPASLQSSASNQALQYAAINPAATINETHQLINLSPQTFRRRHIDIKRSSNKK